MLEIDKKGFITAFEKNKLYHNYFSTFRALENLTKNNWVIKKKSELGDNIYILTPFGINLLVMLKLIPLSKFMIKM